jgi:hypothetical protein
MMFGTLLNSAHPSSSLVLGFPASASEDPRSPPVVSQCVAALWMFALLDATPLLAKGAGILRDGPPPSGRSYGSGCRAS